MLKNYLKVAIRNLTKQKYFTSINIIGLALSIASSALIYLWISHETSFDKYHEDAKNIYRIVTDASLGGQQFEICLVPSPLAKKYLDDCPEVVQTSRSSIYFEQVFKYKDNSFKEEKVILADTGFFKLFNFSFIEGDPLKPFKNKESVILTRSVAMRYFGNESALDKTLIIDQNRAVTVSAVIEDIPSNSHNQFDVALYFDVPDNWGNFNWMTFVKFRDGYSFSKVDSDLKMIVENTVIPTMTGFFGTTVEEFKSARNYINLDLQPLKDIHLNSDYYGELEPPGNKTYVSFFIIIAIFILMIAGINYMNLSTAYYDTRITEVGIRKANGATPGILLRQFLFESVIISSGAYILGALIIEIILPFFTRFLRIEINEGMSGSGLFMFILFLLVIILGIVSGLYPAVYLSRFKTSTILRNRIRTKTNTSFSMRSALVIVQFTITIVVIVATIMVRKQVDFMLKKELGYSHDHLLIVEGTNKISEQKEVFLNVLKENPQILSTSYTDTYPGENYNMITGYQLRGSGPEGQHVMKTISADYRYFETFEMEMLHGRAFREGDRNVLVLNERAVQQFKIEGDPLNQHLIFNDQSLPVIGVVKNFHHEALNITLDPMIIMLADRSNLNNLVIRISGRDTKETVQFIQERWNHFSNNVPFEYYFLDDKLRAAYETEMKAGKVFSIFSVLSIFIACMGILGIASFLLQRKIKEIGIRKVNGATIGEMMALLNKDFIRWVGISFIIATPLAYYGMHKWLSNFAYVTPISWWIFVFAGLLALFVALITVSWHTWRSATRNPVEALRYE